MRRADRAPAGGCKGRAAAGALAERPAGRAFTMLEMMIVVAILGIVMSMTVIALNSSSAETAMSTTEGALQNTTNQFVVRLVAELRHARRTTSAGVADRVRVDATGREIRFQVPVDTDSDGAVDLDANGDAVFGATLGAAHTAGVDIVYRFQADQVGGADEVLDEKTLGIDVNGDGDEADSFKRGFFSRDSTGGVLARAASDRWFLFGDGDGDTLEEPIFVQDAADGTITIRLLAASVMRREKTTIRVLVTTSVRPFNP